MGDLSAFKKVCVRGKGCFPPLKVMIQEVILSNGTEDSKGKEGRWEERRERRNERREKVFGSLSSELTHLRTTKSPDSWYRRCAAICSLTTKYET